jgi:hypothetical protein
MLLLQYHQVLLLQYHQVLLLQYHQVLLLQYHQVLLQFLQLPARSLGQPQCRQFLHNPAGWTH